MTKEKMFMDYDMDARRRIESKLEELDGLIHKLTISTNTKERIENRKYLISTILESYATWSDTGDCLPRFVKLGRLGNDWISVKVVKE